MAIKFYKDIGKKLVEPKLFSDIAEQTADRIAASGQVPSRDGRPRLEKNKRTQLRKFYDEVIRLNTIVKSKPEDFEIVLPYINMLIAKAAYADGRKLVSKEFVDFLKEGVAQVQAPEDFDVFANFFESFMGFYKKYE